ncbi:S1 RNA-binding domain-containing protein [Streptomyces oryzae]|uniref:S1 RNA-binding domain-containing protein n=1 Tax=Streptomyces oryzae TaxID=1434886 RepID=A0ABS3XBU1_9ACTN|nr:S1 RNA-binding domain-containing protein [Streptomyces oryzae]MBO8192835.1 S1 RNA-binding domain-containing protein [Streptomyces oryzae]
MSSIEHLHPGMVCTGTVTASSATVLFVDLGHTAGVVTAPNLSWRHFTHPEQIARVGEKVVGVVLSVDTERDQVSLSLKELEHDPLIDFARTQIGTTTTGTVEKIAPVGVFLALEKDISAFLPAAELSNNLKSVEIGQTYSVIVSSINFHERRIVLSLPD